MANTLRVAVVASGLAVGQTAEANPIRKVVTMLQNVQKKVEAEGEKEEQMFLKFQCYCKTSGSTLTDSIEGSTAKVPQVQSNIEAGEAQVKQLGEDLNLHQSDRAAAKAAIAEATAVRGKEASVYAALKAETSSQIAAINKAVAALEKGAGGAFLQTQSADVLRSIVQSKVTMNDADRDELTSFLSQGADYSPASGEITGILKTLGDEMTASLADATSAEQAGIKSFDGLVAAKKKQIAACTKAIEEKTVRVGELKVNIVEMKADLSDTEEALIEDQKFLADLEKNCATAQDDWDAVCKVRAEEMVALADTIKMLNDDESLELFKQALPGAASSLVQVQSSTASMKTKALAVLHAAQMSNHHPQLDLIALALHGKKVSFDAVIKMIDDMVVLLKKEQVDDANKKEYCNIQLDSLEDSMKGLERSISDSEVAIEDAKETIKTYAAEIEELEAGIKALDKSVAEATEDRKEENSDFTTLMAQDSAAKELLGVAKNRLNKFYNPKLYVPPPKVERSQQDAITQDLGGATAAPTAPGGIAGTGVTVLATISAHQNVAPPPAPERPGAFKKKTEESNGVIAMLDALIGDLDKEMTVAETEEKDAQADYEKMTSDAAEKRATDTKAISEKEGGKADMEAALGKHTEELKSSKKEVLATIEVIQATHGECDWLLQNYDMRKEARTNEIDALTKAKSVLSGADYSLLQKDSSRFLGGRK